MVNRNDRSSEHAVERHNITSALLDDKQHLILNFSCGRFRFSNINMRAFLLTANAFDDVQGKTVEPVFTLRGCPYKATVLVLVQFPKKDRHGHDIKGQRLEYAVLFMDHYQKGQWKLVGGEGGGVVVTDFTRIAADYYVFLAAYQHLNVVAPWM